MVVDGADVVKGLGESMRLQWSGDVDLADGALQRAHEAYTDRLKFIEKLGLGKGDWETSTHLRLGQKTKLETLHHFQR